MDFEKLKNYRNDNNNFAVVNNAHIVSVQEGQAVAEMEITNASYNPVGSVHGGAYFTVADIACGTAASTYGMMVTTLDANIHFLRPGMAIKKLIATGKVVKKGKQIIVTNVSIMDETGKELAEGIITFASLNKPYEIR